jgi:uncharacterized protein with NRDE domain
MCLLLLLHRIVPDFPIVAGANRDEEVSRESLPPIRWPGDPEAVAPIDVRAGGTWIGVNERGLFVSITNRPAAALDARRPSRGLVCREALGATTAADGEARVRRAIARNETNPFNLLLADAEHALVVHHDEKGTKTVALHPGVHVLTNFNDVNSVFLQEVIAAFDPMALAHSKEPASIARRLTEICRDHHVRVPGDHAICKHLGDRGTVSSTIALLRPGTWNRGVFLFADGPPCKTPYHDLSSLLAHGE